MRWNSTPKIIVACLILGSALQTNSSPITGLFATIAALTGSAHIFKSTPNVDNPTPQEIFKSVIENKYQENCTRCNEGCTLYITKGIVDSNAMTAQFQISVRKDSRTQWLNTLYITQPKFDETEDAFSRRVELTLNSTLDAYKNRINNNIAQGIPPVDSTDGGGILSLAFRRTGR